MHALVSGGVDIGELMKKRSSTDDPICCVVASEKILVVARESGSLHRYALPALALTNRYSLATKPHKMSLNCNSTCLSVIDVTGLLQVIE